MNVLVTNLYTAEVHVPPPFDLTLDAAGGAADTAEVPIHIRDLVEYRANPARVDWLREIEQMIKDGKITIGPAVALPIRDASDMDLEEMLFAMAGGNFKQSGILPTGGPVPAIPVPLNSPVPGVNYRVSLTFEGVAGAVPAEVSLLTQNDFLVTFAAPWDGFIHWEITYPA